MHISGAAWLKYQLWWSQDEGEPGRRPGTAQYMATAAVTPAAEDKQSKESHTPKSPEKLSKAHLKIQFSNKKQLL